MKQFEVKAVYTVPELGVLMGGVCRHRVARMLRRMGVPVLQGRPRLVLIADLKALAPAIWASLEEAAHLRRIARGLARRQGASLSDGMDVLDGSPVRTYKGHRRRRALRSPRPAPRTDVTYAVRDSA